MNSSTSAIGALILVPIVIAASAAYIALKTTEFSECIVPLCRDLWDDWCPWSDKRRRQRRRKRNGSDPSFAQSYADSWYDLDSTHSREGFSRFINQSPPRHLSGNKDQGIEDGTARKVWHPDRANRLTWSFTNPRSRSPNPFGSSNVVKPLPAALRPGRSSGENGDGRV